MNDLSDMQMCVEVRKFDSYGEFMGSDKTLMMRMGADLNFETIVKRNFGPATHKRVDLISDDKMTRIAHLRPVISGYSYEITLRETTEEDLEDADEDGFEEENDFEENDWEGGDEDFDPEETDEDF